MGVSVGKRSGRPFARASDGEEVDPADLEPLMCGIAYAVHVHGGTSAERSDAAHR
ncbi:hypothetical protein [Streptomyces sp. NPDC049949]|uniref:hypothetical protein n=1 Tax=Streptomyces sp. NPDC049949 TaxID=3154627 RepID=UPI003435514F